MTPILTPNPYGGPVWVYVRAHSWTWPNAVKVDLGLTSLLIPRDMQPMPLTAEPKSPSALLALVAQLRSFA